MPLGMEVGLSPGDFVLDGDPAPPPKSGRSPQFLGPCLLRPNGCMDQDATWYGREPLPERHCDTWGPSSRSSKTGRSPLRNFRPMCIVAKQGWIKIALGMEMSQLPLPKKGTEPLSPIFGPCLLWPNGWMDEDGTWTWRWALVQATLR